MRWLFIDELIETGPLGRFFSLTSVAIIDEQLSRVRDDLIAVLHPILAKEPNVIPRFPVLHGSDFLRDYTDEDKLSAFQAVITVVLRHRLKIGQIGYFEKDFLGQAQSIPTASMASFSIIDLALKTFDDQIVPVYELGIKNQLNEFQHQYMRFWISKDSLSLPFDRVLGVHFVNKEDHWMQIADVVSWLLWQHSKWKDDAAASDFKKAIVQLGEKLLSEVIYSEIVQMNKPSFNPISGPNGFRPLMLAFPITPSDTEDLAPQAERFWDHLRSVWHQRKGGKTPS